MHDPAIFNFRPNSLVRMSRDDIIDQYKIYPIKIGQGNDAVVYKAKENFEKGKWRAVKKIHRSYIDKEEYLLNEIKILKKLDHPGILKIFQVFDDSEYVFIVTELCQGNSLLKQLKKCGHFSQSKARQVFRRLLQVVSYCHQNKIIHRDLKLQNLVYCTQSSTAQSLRLIDFGMAFQWHSNPRQDIKNTFQSNKIVGTIYYMAPQIRNETYDHRVDIWSCGVLLYVLLTGDLPFHQEQDNQILQAIQERKVCYEKLKKRKCSSQVIDLLKKIFVTQHKRFSIEEILAHPWMKTQKHEVNLQKNNTQYFSLVPYKEFLYQEQFFEYYRQKILEITKNDIQATISSNESNKNLLNYDHLSLNWNNFYQFLNLDEIEKAIKIYFTYRLTHQKSDRYRRVFDHFKCTKKENILLHTLYDSLKKQYEQLLEDIQNNNNSQNLINSEEHHHRKKRQLSIIQDQGIVSVKKVYQKLLAFLDQNKYRTISYTMFLAWICDYQDLDKEELGFLRGKLRNKLFQDQYKRRNIINDEIINIHKIIRKSYIQKKEKCKSQANSQILSTSSSLSTLQRGNRNVPLLSINVQKIKKQQKELSKKPSKKSIKQGILESISPTFIKRKISNPNQNFKTAIQTERQAKGSRLLQHNKSESGFMFGIHKIISLF